MNQDDKKTSSENEATDSTPEHNDDNATVTNDVSHDVSNNESNTVNKEESKPSSSSAQAAAPEHSSDHSSDHNESCCNAKNEHNESATKEKNWQNKNVWKRGIAMLGYGFLAGFVRMAITLIAIFQFFALLFSDKPNMPLVKFGQSLNSYLYQINQFLTVNSEVYPFPLADWPEGSIEEK